MLLLTATLSSLTTRTLGSPVLWDNSPNAEMTEITPVTIIPWPGSARIPGAFLLSRINLGFINNTCSRYSSDLDAAIQLAKTLANTRLTGSTTNQLNRYGYTFLKLETDLLQVLNYIYDLLLCSGRGGELWTKFYAFREQASVIWTMLKKAGVKERANIKNSLPTPSSNQSNAQVGNASHSNTNHALLNYLSQARPVSARQAQLRNPLLIGLGLGFLGSYLFSSIFDTSNKGDIDALNRNIQKQNKLIKITNERLDMLAKNVSNSFDTVKKVLDKLVEQNELADIHSAIQWNLDQLLASITDNRNAFTSSEVTITLLEKGILNPDLIDLASLENIVSEGRKSFPTLDFPIEISRFQLESIVQILKVQKISLHKFLMVIPITHKRTYDVFTLVAHPIRLDATSLVVPELRNVLLKSNDSYIITDKSNMYSLLTTNHLLLEIEPIYNEQKATCEWEAFKKNTTAMLKICNYRKGSQGPDIFMVETDQHRLIYFPEATRVTLECPDHRMKDTLKGLHKLPLACDLLTDEVLWPAKQTMTIEAFNPNNSLLLDSSHLPLITVDKSSEMHSSLRQLINKVTSGDSFTLDFDYHGLQLEQIATYSIFAQSALTIIVVINSLLIAFLLIKWIYHRKRANSVSQDVPLQNKFREFRDSLRSRKERLTFTKGSKTFRDSLRARGSNIRNTIKDEAHQLKYRIQNSPKAIRPPNIPYTVEAGTNTNVNIYPLPDSVPELYPVLPRYT